MNRECPLGTRDPLRTGASCVRRPLRAPRPCCRGRCRNVPGVSGQWIPQEAYGTGLPYYGAYFLVRGPWSFVLGLGSADRVEVRIQTGSKFIKDELQRSHLILLE